MWQAIIRKPVEVIAGLGLLILGIGMPFLKEYGIIVSDSQWVPLIASVATAIGGLVVHRAVSAAVEFESATKLLQPQLEPNTIQLASIRNQLTEAVEGYRNQKLDAQTAMFAVKQSTDALQGLVFNYGRVSGAAIAVDLMRSTKRALDEMRQLVSAESSVSNERMAERLDQIDQQLGETLENPVLAAKRPKPPKKSVMVPCPECASPTNILIGEGVGETAAAKCVNGHGFNAHRDALNKIFTRTHART